MSFLSRKCTHSRAVTAPPDPVLPPSYDRAFAIETGSRWRALFPPPATKDYVYYRLYKPGGAIPSGRRVNNRDPYVGHIEAVHVALPHTVESVIRCICQNERATGHQDAQLFLSTSSSSPADRKEHIAILSGSGPGSDPRQPLSLVLGEDSVVYNKVIKATRDWCESSNGDPKWLNLRQGDILYTDGIVTQEQWRDSSYNAYRAMTVHGQIGFVDTVYSSKPF